MKRLIINSDIPSILKYKKDGVYIKVDKYNSVNFTILYSIDPDKSLDYLEILIDRCECIKHLYQLKSLKNDVMKYEIC